MSSYYYLVASLPALSLEEPPALTSAELRALCREHLTARDMAGLDELLDADCVTPRHPFASAWRRADTHLRNAVVRTRAAALGSDAETFLRPVDGYDMQAENAVSEAYASASPLDRERAIDRFRWRRLEELAGHWPFAPSAVFAYAARLAIAERWAGMDEEAGMGRQQALVTERAAGRNAAGPESETAGTDPDAHE